MGFLYPFFLIAGLTLLIPVLIHLFNLRRYQHVLFPNIRFLRQLQVSSKRAAKIRKKWLLLARILFLAALVLAFAQPFFSKEGAALSSASAVSLVYIDNSMSMTASDGAETLLQKAKKSALHLIKASDVDAKFIILTNDKMAPGRPLSGQEALPLVTAIKPVAQVVDVNRILASFSAAKENDPNERWKVYLLSDFQRATFLPERPSSVKDSLSDFYFLPYVLPGLSNLYIDTAWVLPPSSNPGEEDRIAVVIKESGSLGKNERSTRLQISVDGKTRAVKTRDRLSGHLWQDTIPIQLRTGWKQIVLNISDYPLQFDDTFRISVQSDPALSILVTGSDPMSPFLQSAFSTNEAFDVTWEPLATTHTKNWNQYSLVILQNVDRLPDAVIEAVQARLHQGRDVLLFPGSEPDKSSLNEALQHWGAIHYGKIDTSSQQVVTLFGHQDVLRDIFTSVPENVQLPVTHVRFSIFADITANQQALMSFRDGSPFIAQFRPQNGRLFLVATPLSVPESNFPLSYFFVPVLYQMAIQNQGRIPPSVAIGSKTPIWISMAGNTNRSVWHLSSGTFDAAPRQTAAGNGVHLFVGATAPHTGFFYLRQESGSDSLTIAVNANPMESQVGSSTKEDLLTHLPYVKRIHWLTKDQMERQDWVVSDREQFPIWKVCVLLALLALVIETILLLFPPKRFVKHKETVAP